MREQKRNNVIIAVLLMALIFAAVVGVLLVNKHSSTVANAAAVDCVNDGADVTDDVDDGGISLFVVYGCPDCRSTSFYVSEVTSPTCTSAGYTYYWCDSCDYEWSEADRPALGHDYSVLIEKNDGNCTTAGYEIYKCSRCDSTKTVHKGLGEHRLININFPATCTSEGQTGQRCKNCSYSIITKTPALGHNVQERVKTEATCNKAKIIEKYCAECNEIFETYEDGEPTYDHVFGHTETVGATCTQSGTEYAYCANCGEVYMYGDIPELGHDYSVELERAEYCTELGHVKYKCSRCDETKTETAAALGHAYEFVERIEPTCEDEGYSTYKCSRCSDVKYEDYADMLGHDRVERVVEEANCGLYGRGEIYCARCGEVFEEYTIDPTYKHNNVLVGEDEAECLTSKRNVYECTVCGARHYEDVGEPLGHNYEVSETLEPDCETSGYKIWMCTREHCKEYYQETLSPLGHSYEIQIEYHAADCEHDEISIYKCVRCDKTIDKGKQKALGHIKSQRLILEATGEYPAIYEIYCTVCGEVFGTVTGEEIWNEDGGGSSDNNGGDNDGKDDNSTPAPKVNALKILKMCLFFAYCWIALGVSILCIVMFFKRLRE